MAELSSMEAVKNRKDRKPSGRAVALHESAEAPTSNTKRQRPGRNHLYNVEVVEEEENKVKIHYVGYSSKHDEWIRKSEIAYKPSCSCRATDADLSLTSALACAIKQKLVPRRKLEDPAVRIQLPFDSATFQLLQAKGKLLTSSRGNKVYTVEEYNDLDELLGERWHIRVANIYGDFSYVILSTIRFYLTQPAPLLDFDVRQHDTELQFEPFYLPQQMALVFQFVRGDGNKHKLTQLL